MKETGQAQSLVWCHFADLKKGVGDLKRYLEKHNPEVVIFDISPPYDANWKFYKTMRDDNGAQRATSIERGEASPQRHVNLLEEVEPAVMSLIRPRESLRSAVRRRRFGVQVVLSRVGVRRRSHSMKVVAAGPQPKAWLDF
ncbi:MAG TPA: hypothetical protein VNZ26_09930 [Vicinamibacterales bacterium]|nr:hypothetical protein [Vicinamibacterales bacterium]